MWMSLPQMEAASTSMRISPGPGSGTGISSRSAPGPGRVLRSARISPGMVTRTGYFSGRNAVQEDGSLKEHETGSEKNESERRADRLSKEARRRGRGGRRHRDGLLAGHGRRRVLSPSPVR